MRGGGEQTKYFHNPMIGCTLFEKKRRMCKPDIFSHSVYSLGVGVGRRGGGGEGDINRRKKVQTKKEEEDETRDFHGP